MAQISDHTQAVFRGLRTAASEARLVTYRELAEAAAINPRSVGAHLTTIHARLRDRSPGLPWLVAIAVESDTGLPGAGPFKGEGLVLAMENPSHKVWWKAMVAAVFAADWSEVELS